MSIAENLERVRAQVAAACMEAGRSRESVALMAVSKVHPVASLVEAYRAGQRLFGENRVQEFAEKYPEVAGLSDARFHLIGPLQNNKTSRAAELFHAVDTVTSVKTAQRLDSSAQLLGKQISILVEVKLSHEEAKHGVAPEELPPLLDSISGLRHLEVCGLMTVPPWSEDPEVARPYFRRLRELRDGLQGEHPKLVELSMGMSNDFAVAIEEGSTTVRVGTALFGKRPTPPLSGEQ